MHIQYLTAMDEHNIMPTENGKSIPTVISS